MMILDWDSMGSKGMDAGDAGGDTIMAITMVISKRLTTIS
jgi:hypothetical protein